MARLIVNCRYVKPCYSVRRSNYIRYLGTRPNAEKTNFPPNSPATEKQIALIAKLQKVIPNFTKSLEYTDYKASPSAAIASELINEMIEHNMDLVDEKSILMKYIAERPRSERIFNHGLFNEHNQPIVLKQAQDEVANHPGNVWSLVFSLHREDAERLGYDNAAVWQKLIKEKMGTLSSSLNIPMENLRWYAAFHNESHHPHIHMVIFSSNPTKGFLAKHGLAEIKSSFAQKIFEDENLYRYKQKTQVRDELRRTAQREIALIVEQIKSSSFHNLQMEEKLLKLSEQLKHHKGKPVYGYLTQTNKKLVNEIVAELGKEPHIAELYSRWCILQNDIVSTYKLNPDSPPPIEVQEEFKPIKNAVISEAVRLQSDRIHFAKGRDVILVAKEEKFETKETISATAQETVPETDTGQTPAVSPQGVAVLKLLRYLSRIIQDDCRNKQRQAEHISADKKLHRREAEKKQALGIKL